LGAADLPQMPPRGQILYRPVVLVNAYMCAKFQLPSSINYGDMITPGAVLIKCGMWGGMVDIGICRLSGVGVVRGAILPSLSH